MRCPFCGHEDTQVKDSRPTEDGSAIRRRRSCGGCSQRFSTIERVQLRELTVVKTDGRRVPFDRDKLARSVRIALRKRPVDDERIELIVNGIVRRLEASGEADIASKLIGEQVPPLGRPEEVALDRFRGIGRRRPASPRALSVFGGIHADRIVARKLRQITALAAGPFRCCHDRPGEMRTRRITAGVRWRTIAV